ncbi:hypothetical protein DB42_DF00040 [Neochlamydia sp. EPS4]|nr:hypothetical protein DB42_DF00040 [Neochlamydia sp. EPS4]
MRQAGSSSYIHLDDEEKNAVWTTGGPLTGKTTQLSTINFSSLATVNPNNNQEEKGSAVKGIDERKNSDGSVSYRARVRAKGHAPIPKPFSSLI